ncbi:hypothetical protein P879_11190, partial [Paragonimus westermani]
TRIHLPTNYDPLALINSYEGLCRFFASETPKLVQLDLSIGSSETSPVVSMKTLFDRDVEAIACFAVELYTYSVVNYSEADQWNHAKRVKLARHNARLYWDRIPYCLHRGLRLVLQPFVDETQNLLSSARFLPSTSQLLNVLFEFPSYLFDLHMVIQWVEKRIDVIGSRSSDVACSFDKNSLPATNQLVNWPLRGDASAMAILQCLKLLVDLYGVSFVSFVYLPFVRRTVKTVAMTMRVGTLALDASGGSRVCFNENSCTWNARTFGSLVAALTFLHQLITFIPDSLLLDLLQDSLLQDLLTQVIRIVGRHDCSYPGSSRGRRALLYRLIDCIYVLGRRVGFELTRTHMTSLFQMFFALFDRVAYVKGRTNRFRAEINAASEYSVGCPPFVPGHNDTRRPTVREDVAQELYDTFTPELARLAYILFCRLAGGAYMDAYLYNAELIHSLIPFSLRRQNALLLETTLLRTNSHQKTHGRTHRKGRVR